MKRTSNPTLITLLGSIALGGALIAGPMDSPIMPEADAFNGFEDARRPITNPTLFDLAIPRTLVHPIFMYHRFPSKINVNNLGKTKKVPFDGDLQLYALQFEYAFTDTLSLVALKDGYIDFNPDDTFSSDEGFANVGGGLKYAFILDPAAQFAMSGTVMYELPIGDSEVFQGKGDGNFNLTLNALKLHQRWQFAGAAGLQIPVDDDFSTQGFLSGHISYEISKWFIPLVEINWFTVLDEGDGGRRFRKQVDGFTPLVAPSEGADLVNWGAGNSEEYVTLGLGWRTRINENVNVGFAYEFPLTEEENNITEDRFTVDLVWTF